MATLKQAREAMRRRDEEDESKACVCGHTIAEHVHNGTFAKDWYCMYCSCVGPRIQRGK